MASSLYPLLESFYERFEPRGVAFVGSSKFGVSFGRSAASVLPSLESAVGFTQIHLEDAWVSITLRISDGEEFWSPSSPFRKTFRLHLVHGWPSFALQLTYRSGSTTRAIQRILLLLVYSCDRRVRVRRTFFAPKHHAKSRDRSRRKPPSNLRLHPT